MKVFWFSNCDLLIRSKDSGSWLYAMSSALLKNGVKIVNLTEGKCSYIKKEESEGIIQYVIPRYKIIDGLPSKKNISKICSIVEQEAPDLVHIWGTEKYWGLLTSRGYILKPTILEIQGLITACARICYGNLTISERIKCVKLKELLKPSSSIFSLQRSFSLWSPFEKEIIEGHKWISTQSEWVRNHINSYAKGSKEVIKTLMPIREPFFRDDLSWQVNNSRTIIVMSSGPFPYKGVQDVIKSLYYIKKDYSKVKLKIIGIKDSDSKPWRKSGFTKLLNSLVKENNLSNNIEFLGAMDAESIAKTMQCAEVMVIPSYIESYCLAMAEAMAIGLPCVSSYAGALPELGDNNTIYYQPGDIESLAAGVKLFFSNDEFKKRASAGNRIIANKRNDIDKVYKRQYDIYSSILNLI